jgi:hypothetical protein
MKQRDDADADLSALKLEYGRIGVRRGSVNHNSVKGESWVESVETEGVVLQFDGNSKLLADALARLGQQVVVSAPAFQKHRDASHENECKREQQGGDPEKRTHPEWMALPAWQNARRFGGRKIRKCAQKACPRVMKY